MRLTEEIVALLKLIERKSDLSGISSDAIEDAVHEGLIAQNGHDAKKLTASGKQTLTQIQNALITADQLSIDENAKIAYLPPEFFWRPQ